MATIQITDVSPRIQYTASGGQTVFTIPFVFFATTDIKVYKTPVGTTPDDATNILNSGYTVATNGSYTGTVTLSSGATAGDVITIVRAMPDQRLNYYTSGGALTADMLNNDAESEVLMIQQNKLYNQEISPRYNLTAPVATADLVLPQLGANQTWVKNAANNAIITATNPLFPVGSITSGGGTLNHLARWDTGLQIQDSVVLVDDSGNISGATWAGTTIAIAEGGTGATTAAGARTNLGLGTAAVQADTYFLQTANNLSDIPVAATARTNLGLGTAATHPATDFLLAASNLSDVANAATARTNLGLAIGTDVQAHSATLDAVTAGTYTGSSSITTLGTIATGTWNGTVVGSTYGGTGVNNGASTITLAGNLVTAGANSLTFTTTGATNVTLPTSGTLCTTVGSSSIVTVGTITSGVWNGTTIAIANGGTGQTSKTPAFNALSPITTKGDLITSDGTNNVRLAAGTDTFVLTADSTAPNGIKWAAAASGSVTSVSGTATRISSTGGTTPVLDLVTTAVTPGSYTNTDLTVDAYGRITAASNGSAGGSGTTLSKSINQVAHGFSVGQAVYYTGTTYALSQADTAAHAEFIGMVSAVADADNFTLSGPGYISGLSGLTAGSVHFISPTSAGALTTTITTTAGQIVKPVLIADSTTSGFLTNMRGEYVPVITGPIDQTTTSVTMVKGNTYYADNAALVTLTIPATAAQGDVFEVVGGGAGGWKVQANTGQTIRGSGGATTSGGSLSSTTQWDCVTIKCFTANTTFVVTASEGNLTTA